MIRYHEALTILTNFAIERARLRRAEVSVPVQDLFGCVLSEPIVAPEDFPAFDAATMDGFAVKCAVTEQAALTEPVRLRVAGQVFAGQAPDQGSLPPDAAIEISTGAPLPPDFDSVVRIEDVTVTTEDGEKWLTLRKPVIRGDSVRYRSSDVRKGLVILDKGTRIDAQHLPLLTALGVKECKAWRRPRVALVATGDELATDDGGALPFGRIRNSTSSFLSVLFQTLGCEVSWYGNLGDDAGELARVLEECAYGSADVLISTGGVSVGPHDFAKEALRKVESEILFHRVAMRPGRPVLCARLGPNNLAAPIYFGLPGNPMSTVVASRFLVTPYLRTFLGLPPERPLRLRIGNSSAKAEGLFTFLLGKVAQTDGGLEVFAHAEQESFRVLPLARSNAWILAPEVRKGVSRDELVEVLPLFSEGFAREWLV